MEAHKHRMRTSSEDPNWRTPYECLQALRKAFPYTIDLAADVHSQACAQLSLDEPFDYLGPDHEDQTKRNALTVNWYMLDAAIGFLNPPYSISKIRELRKELDLRFLQNVLPEEQEKIRQHYDRLIAALRIENWAAKAYEESLHGFTTIGLFPYAPQTKWFRRYVMGHEDQEGQREGIDAPDSRWVGWSGHAALDFWRLSHRVTYLRPDGSLAANANVNSCVIIWGPNPGFVGPWVPTGRYWSYR